MTDTLRHKHIGKRSINGRWWSWRITIVVNGKHHTKDFRCYNGDTEPPAEVITTRDQMLRDLRGVKNTC